MLTGSLGNGSPAAQGGVIVVNEKLQAGTRKACKISELHGSFDIWHLVLFNKPWSRPTSAQSFRCTKRSLANFVDSSIFSLSHAARVVHLLRTTTPKTRTTRFRATGPTKQL